MPISLFKSARPVGKREPEPGPAVFIQKTATPTGIEDEFLDIEPEDSAAETDSPPPAGPADSSPYPTLSRFSAAEWAAAEAALPDCHVAELRSGRQVALMHIAKAKLSGVELGLFNRTIIHLSTSEKCEPPRGSGYKTATVMIHAKEAVFWIPPEHPDFDLLGGAELYVRKPKPEPGASPGM